MNASICAQCRRTLRVKGWAVEVGALLDRWYCSERCAAAAINDWALDRKDKDQKVTSAVANAKAVR